MWELMFAKGRLELPPGKEMQTAVIEKSYKTNHISNKCVIKNGSVLSDI